MKSVLLMSLIVLVGCQSGVRVGVTNGRDHGIEAVQVLVSGSEYTIGNLEPGQRASVRVTSKGESRVEILHAGAGAPLVVDTYLEPGYSGEIEVRLEGDSLRVLKNSIRHY